MADHAHDWQPVLGYVGRYRCVLCGAFGYKSRPVTGFGNYEVVAYKCKMCSAPAVGHDPVSRTTLRYGRKAGRSVGGRKEWRCKDHRSEWA